MCAVERMSTQANLIPRVTFRELADAELFAKLVRGYSYEMMQRAQMLRDIQHLEATGAVIAHLVDESTGQEITAQQAKERFAAQLLRAAELLAAIIPELVRLQTQDGELSEEDRMFNDEFSGIVTKLLAETTGEAE